MANIIWAQEARANLHSIYHYIAGDNPHAAERILEGIYERVEQLADAPMIGHLVEWENQSELRSLNYGHYRIVYLYSQERVAIVGVFHGAVDIQRHLPDTKNISEEDDS